MDSNTTIFKEIFPPPNYENKKYINMKNFINSDNVMKNGILIGCHHGLSLKELRYMTKKFDTFFKKI